MGIVGSRQIESEQNDQCQQQSHNQKPFAISNIKSYHVQTSLGSASSHSVSKHSRAGSVRVAPRQPMPDVQELECRFTKVLVSKMYHCYLFILKISPWKYQKIYRCELIFESLV